MLEYIKAEKAAGTPPAQVRQHLLAAGWKEVEVDAALVAALAPAARRTAARAAAAEPRPVGPKKVLVASAKPVPPAVGIIGGVILFVIGLALIFYGVQAQGQNQALSLRGRTTEGKVVAIERRTESYRDQDYQLTTTVFYRPVVSYTAGALAFVCFGSWSSLERYSVGQSLPVIYLQDRPEVSRLDKPGEMYSAGLAEMFVGAVLAAAGVLTVLGFIALTARRSGAAVL